MIFLLVGRVQHMREHYPEHARTLYEPYQFKHYVKDYVELLRADDVMEAEEVAALAAQQGVWPGADG